MAEKETIIGTLKTTFKEWKRDDASTWAASVAYYTVFSLAPLAILAVAIAGFVVGQEAAQGELVSQIEGAVGSAGAEVIQTAIANASGPGGGGIIATVIGIALLLLGASKVFAELKTALNRMWDVRVDPDAGWKETVRQRLVGFAMILGVGLVLLLSVAASTFLSGLGQVAGQVPAGQSLWMALNVLVSIAILVAIFAAIFYYVPDVDIDSSDVWIGAIVTAILFTLGKLALGVYLSQGSVGSAYGAASSLVVLLAWVYYSSQIFFIGAELTKVIASRRGHRVEPDSHAVTEEEFAGQTGHEPSPA